MGFGEERMVRNAMHAAASAALLELELHHSTPVQSTHIIHCKSHIHFLQSLAHQVKEGKCTVALNRQEQNLWELWVFSLG